MKDLDDTTMYREIRSFPAATTMRIGREGARLEDARALRYWAPPRQRLAATDISLDEAAAELRNRLFDAVSLRLRADVEVACELSGGMDSSSIVAAAATLRDRPITTFTVKVPEQDEEPFARTMLERYRLDYRVMLRPERAFLGDADDFTALMEEPYHSPNIYTHFLMRRSMKTDGAFVVLAGAGGDEVLAGYEHLFWPRAAAELCDAGLRDHVERYDRARGCYRAPTIRQRLSGRWWRARAAAFNAAKRLLGRTLAPALEGLSADAYQARYASLSFQQQQLYHQRVAMLPYYLRSNDHFTMEIPIEARYPFLDYRIVELGLQVPIQYLFQDGWTKYLLRRAMEGHLPREIVWRREKMGFPFDYQGFLNSSRPEFEPALHRLDVLGTSPDRYGSYDALLAADPMKLWRLCSTALWLGKEEAVTETSSETAA
ncbi:MAG TPA: asparagine synthase C-terminal domain-containing protein, partial [Gemmatimonadales bacterium]